MLSTKLKIYTAVILVTGSIGVIKVNMLLLVLSMLLICLCMTTEILDLYRKTEKDMM